MGFGGSSSGGNTQISTASDVAFNNSSNGHVISYNSSTQKWTNVAVPAGVQSALNTKVSTSGGITSIWNGTQAEYNALSSKNAQTLYVITES